MSENTQDSRKGLTVDVYRTATHGMNADFSLGGVSATHNELTITGVVESGTDRRPVFRELDSYSQVFAVRDDKPEAWLYQRQIFDKSLWCVIPAMPADYLGGIGGWVSRLMFGGNYASTSDSRLSTLVDFYGALAIHDRCESGR